MTIVVCCHGSLQLPRYANPREAELDCATVFENEAVIMSSTSKQTGPLQKSSNLNQAAIAAKRAKSVDRLILIADDNDDTRMMFATVLTARGYRIAEAGDGEKAIEVILRENPGLVLLDLELPRLNGLSVLRRLRNELKRIDVPVVVITGYEQHFETAVAAGCDDYLLKPIDFERLETLLDYYLPLEVKAKGA